MITRLFRYGTCPAYELLRKLTGIRHNVPLR